MLWYTVEALIEMYGQNPKWLWSNGEPLRHHRHLGRLGSATLRQWEDEEEGKEEEHAIWTREHPAICCYTTSKSEVYEVTVREYCRLIAK